MSSDDMKDYIEMKLTKNKLSRNTQHIPQFNINIKPYNDKLQIQASFFQKHKKIFRTSKARTKNILESNRFIYTSIFNSVTNFMVIGTYYKIHRNMRQKFIY